MSSNEYSACLSRNLVRTSTFAYRDQADLCMLLETGCQWKTVYQRPSGPCAPAGVGPFRRKRQTKFKQLNSADTYPGAPKEKGQMRSNREIRKPKKGKTAAVAPAPSGAQVKLTGGNPANLGKK